MPCCPKSVMAELGIPSVNLAVDESRNQRDALESMSLAMKSVEIVETVGTSSSICIGDRSGCPWLLRQPQRRST